MPNSVFLLTNDHIHRQLSQKAPDGAQLSRHIQSPLLSQVGHCCLDTGGWWGINEGKRTWVSQAHTLHLHKHTHTNTTDT